MLLNEYTNGLKKEICNNIVKIFSTDIDISADEIILSKPPTSDLGDYTLACFPLAKNLKKSPVKIAEQLAQDFSCSLITETKAVGPYLNIYVDKIRFAEIVCTTVVKQQERYGSGDKKNKKIMIEYSSPNTNKPLHLGHLRNNVLGIAVANILEFSGYEVVKVNLVNDRGIHICKSMLAYEKWGNSETPESTSIKGDHFVGKYYKLFDAKLKEEKDEYAKNKNIDPQEFSSDILKNLKNRIKKCENAQEKKELRQTLKELERTAEEFETNFIVESKLYNEAQEMLQKWENEDKQVRALWKKMNSWVMDGFHQTYEKLGCTFDNFYFESDTFQLGKEFVETGLAKGIFYKKENGSIWVSGESLIERNPEIFKKFAPKDKLLLRSDGTSVYITQDIGTTVLKHKDCELDECLFLVGEEQGLHFKTLFCILDLLGFSWAKNCRHISYGMVTLPDGKLKSREGTTVDADELVAEMEQRVLEKIKKNDKLETIDEETNKIAEQIALAALKLFLLNISKEKALLFDPNKALSEEKSSTENRDDTNDIDKGEEDSKKGKSGSIAFSGDTGPYIQYGYARIQGIFRNVEKKAHVETVDYALLNSDEEVALIHKVADFPQIVTSAAETDNPHIISGYLLELTRSLFKFYNVHSVANAEPNYQNARLLLCDIIAQTIKNGMKLLGMSVPERM